MKKHWLLVAMLLGCCTGTLMADDDDNVPEPSKQPLASYTVQHKAKQEAKKALVKKEKKGKGSYDVEEDTAPHRVKVMDRNPL